MPGVYDPLMPLPRSVARGLRRFLNPLIMRRGLLPVLVHVGRSSGHTHRTPLAAYAFDGGYLFTINYGPQSDWPQNVMKAGTAKLEKDGAVVKLADPQLLPAADAYALLPPNAKLPPSLIGVEQCLMMSTDQSGQDKAP